MAALIRTIFAPTTFCNAISEKLDTESICVPDYRGASVNCLTLNCENFNRRPQPESLAVFGYRGERLLYLDFRFFAAGAGAAVATGGGSTYAR